MRTTRRFKRSSRSSEIVVGVGFFDEYNDGHLPGADSLAGWALLRALERAGIPNSSTRIGRGFGPWYEDYPRSRHLSFFRDEEVFEGSQENSLPEILKHKAKGAPVRLWAAGCSTARVIRSPSPCSRVSWGFPPARTQSRSLVRTSVNGASEKAARVFPDSAIQDLSGGAAAAYLQPSRGGYRHQVRTCASCCVFVRQISGAIRPSRKMDSGELFATS